MPGPLEPCRRCGCVSQRHEYLATRVAQLEAVLGVLDLTCTRPIHSGESMVACGTCPECVALRVLDQTRRDL